MLIYSMYYIYSTARGKASFRQNLYFNQCTRDQDHIELGFCSPRKFAALAV